MKTFVFESSDNDFGNSRAAEQKAAEMGFITGASCGGLPLACYSSASGVVYVGKWRNLTAEERANAGARIVYPDMDMRNGKAVLLVKDSADETFPRYSNGDW